MRQAKTTKKRRTEVPENRTHATRPNHKDPTKPSRPPRGTTVRRGRFRKVYFLELWHGGAVRRGTTVLPPFCDAT